jgi:hypothetical protein
MKRETFWDIGPCGLVEVDRRFRGAYWMVVLHACETSVNFYETTRRNVTEGCHPRTRRRQNLESQSLGQIRSRCVSINSYHFLFSLTLQRRVPK